MKKRNLLFVQCCFALCAFAQPATLEFRTSDTALQYAFYRARTMALQYRGNPGDPVGPWYEAALPSRQAFCMRDVSHQVIGADLIGFGLENKNMLSLFARNISESKDCCSYWEINKYNQPAPEDYRNDREFWYNINANFDLIDACWRLYLWTGDCSYIKGDVFAGFFQRSAVDYINRWILHEDSLLTRPAYPNRPFPFNRLDYFHRCRGLASYSESVDDLKMGVDIVAAIYRGLLSYAQILKESGKHEASSGFEQRALRYRKRLEQDWWDEMTSLYHTYYTTGGHFGKGEGEVFLLWFDALCDSLRKQQTIAHLISVTKNIETESYLPLLLYIHGYWEKAYAYLLHLTDPATPRREYPEVSFAVVEGIVKGLMGVEPNATRQSAATIFRGKAGTVGGLTNLTLLHTVVDISHGERRTEFFNKGNVAVTWKAVFEGRHTVIQVDNSKKTAIQGLDKGGTAVSWVEMKVKPGERVIASCD